MTKTLNLNKNFFNQILNKLQRLGKALMFPIAVLPIAAVLLRVGALISDPLANNSADINQIQIFIGKVLSTPGGVVFDNLAIIFAIGVAFGLAKDNRGEAALVGAIVWFGMTALLKEGLLASVIWNKTFVSADLKDKSMLLYFLKNNEVKYQLDTGVLGGIISGLITSMIYNKFKDVKLPISLSFFGGRRFIPMLGVLVIIPLALVFAIIWPLFQFALIQMGQGLSSASGPAKSVSVGVYAFFNRILQPFGLHHILNTFVWFQLPVSGKSIIDGTTITVNGDITAFQKGILGSGLFTTGFFPLFLGGLPGAALAMIVTSDKEKRKQMAVFFGGATLVSWLTGIDEPLVFSFIFVSPILYLWNALLTGVFYTLVTLTGMSIGIGFSAGFIDYVVSFGLSWQMSGQIGFLANPLWVWLFAIIMFFAYYFSFYFIIKKMKVATPGRERQLGLEEVHIKSNPDTQMSAQDKYQIMAENILDVIGEENIELVENCATRLRFTLKNNNKNSVDDNAIMKTGARGVVRVGDKGYQVIVGTDVEHVADALKNIIGKK